MKFSFYIWSALFLAPIALQSADLIQKNIEKQIRAQEIAHQNLLSQMAELALKDIDTSELTTAETEQLKKNIIQLIDKELKKDEFKQTTHGRHNSI